VRVESGCRILLGGEYLFPDLTNPTLQTVLAAIGAIVLLPLGIYFLVRVVKEPLRAYASARQHWDEGTVPGHMVAEVGNGAALNIFNPLTMTYWWASPPCGFPSPIQSWATAPPGWEF
jgi:threonine/homoserine/homoserine lactone efflux protein